MRFVPLSLLTIAALGVSLSPVSADIPGWHSDFDSALQEAQQTDQPMLLHFYADWCFPCKRMEKDVLSRPAVVQVLSAKLILVKVNVDHHPELAKRFNVNQFPSDVIVDPSGQRILSSTGYQEADKYVSFVRHAEEQYVGKPAPIVVEETIDEPTVEPMIALDGYCPVSLAHDRSWVKGDSRYSVEHRGQVYYLTSAEAKAEFDVAPQQYVPRLLGCDPVVLRDTDLAVPGSIRYGAFYDDELFLFSSQDNRVAFKADPERYTRTRVVRNANEIDRTVLR